MPGSSENKHLKRLSQIWIADPLYFITACTCDRRTVLASDETVRILIEAWEQSLPRYGWSIGSYVVMPDHVHFFCRAVPEGKSLSIFMGKWKEWTSKRMIRDLNYLSPVWQKEFFDHILRSEESYSEKWNYVRNNPVRAGLVFQAEDWKYQGHVHFL